MAGFQKIALAASGSTNNAAMPGVEPSPASQDYALEFVIEAVGATPTITFKLQGTFDRPEDANDASANWFDIQLLPSASDTSLTSDTKTAAGAYVYFLSLAQSRFLPRRVRLVPSLNTNVTFRANLQSRFRN